MASNRIWTSGPIPLTTTLTTNLLNPPVVSGGVNAGSAPHFIIVRHMSVLNKTNAAATCSFYRGATAGNVAGTEVFGIGLSVPPNWFIERNGVWRFDLADFLVGGAGTTTALVLHLWGEIGLV